MGQIPWPTTQWEAASPARLGLNKDALAALDRALASGKYGHIDGLLVIRHGQVGYEKAYRHDYAALYKTEASTKSALNSSDPGGPYNYFNPWWHPYYHATDLHTLQSVTKTVTSVIIGVAIARHEFPDLDTPVLRFFDTTAVQHIDGRKRRMTLRHLLTMTAGLAWNEDRVPYADPTNDGSRMEAGHDWVTYALDKPMAAEPGTAFNYNGGATQTLAHVFRVATGLDLEEYGAKYLFKPLGIRRYYWKRAPTGLADAQGGLYLAQRDLAKIGYLYLHAGKWQDQQLVSAAYVRQSVAPVVRVSPDVAYGYQWWRQSYGKTSREVAWRASGFGGQFALVLPEYDAVVVLTGWNILPNMPYPTAALLIDALRRAVDGPTQTSRVRP
ncbi:serine hydrolase domain-containing protein [Hymenobacter artigasi]|uniref:CubicO group peptidase (Beta-lactamase class C family) n=1 Tax=Hymenobacter artigasi TaxID=2719616 RepID=A0ABX1HRD8_9BACT|nr:serine hydrolase [Hymenobacter artigasi]NKI91868.1 CubicO group peptidase (beta-lactamase class C family) [Hymenobacter artigasi]